MRRSATFAVLVLFLLAHPASAEVKLNALFSDGVVLLRDTEIPVWGAAKPGAEVTVTLDGAKQTAKTDDAGKWKVKLSAHAAGGPFELTATEAGGNTVAVKDVQFGEVWLASGQSNMHWSFSHAIKDGAKELEAANDPLLRQFTTKKGGSGTPMADTSGKWHGANKEGLLADGANGSSAVGYFFGRRLREELKVPVGIINSSVGGTPIEQWSPGEKGGLYNNMIHPLGSFPIRGAIWYQGESNVRQGMAYVDLTKKQVEAWRKQWGRDIPYYFVQIAPYTYAGKSKGTVAPFTLPLFWEAQTQIRRAVPNTSMVIISDAVHNVNDIHPLDKQVVGLRLANTALARDYGKSDLVYASPRFASAERSGDSIRIKFTDIGGGLASRDGKPLTEFTIAGADHQFVPAEATIEGEYVAVKSADVKEPVAVRFAWHEQAMPNLMNKEGLPANSFRTDEWKLEFTPPPVEAKPAEKK